MPKTSAERQRDYCQRRAGRITALEAAAVELRTEADSLLSDLDAALGEAQRLALTACRHPSAAVDAARAGPAAPRSGSRTVQATMDL
jgi:hypothetical protein